MKSLLFSVNALIYKVEKYLPECINSVSSQGYYEVNGDILKFSL